MDARLKDKDWRLSHFYKIKDKKKTLLTFKRNKAQEHFNEHKHSRNIILKSRQLGFTTDEAVDTLDDALFTKNFEGLLIANDLENAKNIFDNKVKLAWDNFRLQHLYNVDLNSARKIKIGFGDGTSSSITVDNSGRSGTYNRVHVSEFAKLCKMFPDRAKEVIEGTIPAVPTDGRVDIESTAEEAQGLFYELFWEAWDRGEPQHKTQFKSHFYNWQWDPEIEETEPIKDLPKEFREYQAKYKLSDREIAYYYLKFVALGENERNWATMRKEYPTTPEEAFAGAGNKLFDWDKLGVLTTKTPIKRMSNDKLLIYKEYQLGHFYAMACDVAEGVGRDSSTIVLVDFTPAKPEVVAEYASNEVAPDLFAFEIKNLGEKYELPLVAVERNNHGHTTLAKLRDIYPARHIYMDPREEGKKFPKLGWETTLVSKPKMMFDLNTAIENELFEVISPRIISEMRRYDKEDLRIVRANEETTAHYDLLMATAIAFQMKDFVRAPRGNRVNRSSSGSVVRGKGMRGT